MNANARRSMNLLAAAGLVLGGFFGMLGTVVAQASLRRIFWGIDGSALVMAASLLALKYLRKESDLVAAGFLAFAIGQGLIVSGAAASLAASVPSFAAGAALWAVALLLISVPREFAIWTRLLGIVSAILFAFTSARILWGERLLPTSSPLPYFAYPFLVLTFVGWIWTLLREKV